MHINHLIAFDTPWWQNIYLRFRCLMRIFFVGHVEYFPPEVYVNRCAKFAFPTTANCTFSHEEWYLFIIQCGLIECDKHEPVITCYVVLPLNNNNERDGVSNHQPHDCLLNRLFRRRWKKTSNLRVTGPLCGNSPVTAEFPAQRSNNAENVSICWRHHDAMLPLFATRFIACFGGIWVSFVEACMS